MIIASITRSTGDLVVSTEPHPKTGAPMVLLAHVRADETVSCRTPLQPSELPQVIAALQLAAQKLKAPGASAQHRTVRAEPHGREQIELQLEEDAKLF